jgi:DNA repair protein RadC
MKTEVRTEDPAPYRLLGDIENDTIARALEILERRVNKADAMSDPRTVRSFLTLRAAHLEHEEFTVMFLDSHNRPLATETMFRGTLTQTSVYPREIVKAALRHNAAGVILSHNHPSGQAEPSRADEFMTQTLKASLHLVDVRVLDHVIVGGSSAVSMAERGLI